MIGLGNGFEKLMQGYAASREDDRADRRIDMRDKQFEQLSTQFRNQQRSEAKNKFNRALLNAEEFGDWAGVERVSKEYPEMFGDTRFERVEPEFIVGTNPKQFTNAFRNRFNDSTGLDLPAGSTTMMVVPQGDGAETEMLPLELLSVSRELSSPAPQAQPQTAPGAKLGDGAELVGDTESGYVNPNSPNVGDVSTPREQIMNRVIATPHQLAAGIGQGTNYPLFREEYFRDRAMANVEALRGQTRRSPYMQAFDAWSSATDPEVKATLGGQLDKLSTDKGTELEGLFGMLQQDEMKEFHPQINDRIKMLTTYAPKSVPAAIQTLEYKGGKSEDLAKNITNNLKVPLDEPITDYDSVLESKVRSDSDRYTPSIKKLEESVRLNAQTLSGANRLDELLRSKDFRSGPLDNVMTYIDTITPEELLSASPEQIAADAGINALTAKILKDASGQSATEAEALRTMLTVVGDPNAQEAVRLNTLSAFMDERRAQIVDGAKQLRDAGLNVTAKDALGFQSTPVRDAVKLRDANEQRIINKYFGGQK